MVKKVIFFCILFQWHSISFANIDVPILFPRAEILNEHTARIPFKVIDQLIVVEAKLMGKTGNFIIDTGSETLILNKAHFNTLYHFNEKKVQTSGVHDFVDRPSERILSEFILQNFKLTDKLSDVIDLSHIEKIKKINVLGIIGYSILKEYEVFIDMHLSQITLSKTDAQGDRLDKKVYLEKIIDSIPFKLKKHSIILNTQIGDQKLKFALDSGSEFNQLNKRRTKKTLKYFYPIKRINLSGASGKKIEALAGKLYRVQLSETLYFGPMKTILTNLNNLNEAFGTNLDGVLGFEFFKQKRTIINYKKEKLYFINYPLIRQ